MSLKKIDQLKKDRGFRIFDLIIYGVIVVLLVALFIAVFATRDTAKLSGVRIFVHGEKVFEYEFGGQPVASGSTFTENADGITVTIEQENGDLNVVYIDKKGKTVSMKQANCRGKVCMYFSAMKNNSDFISCAPHGIRVEPFRLDLDNPNIIF